MNIIVPDSVGKILEGPNDCHTWLLRALIYVYHVMRRVGSIFN